MTENLGRKTTLVVVVTLIFVAILAYFPLTGQKMFRLGLDLQGGTRLVYKFDFEQAARDGVITQQDLARKQELLQETATIIRGRVDPKGVMELSLRPEGENNIVIELPGAAETVGTATFGKLTKPIAADPTAPEGRALEIETTDPRIVNSFGMLGGTVRIDGEKILYKNRSGGVLNVEDNGRGFESTVISAHEAGATVELISNDLIQRQIENVGDMQFYLQAEPNDFVSLGTDQATEQKKVDDWRRTNPTLPVDDFNRTALPNGGPAAGLKWFPERQRADQVSMAENQRRVVPLVLPRPKTPGTVGNEWVFTGNDIGLVGSDADELGYPAVAFEMKTEKQNAFGDFTAANINRLMAVVMNGEIVTLATINGRLQGRSQITGGRGGFTNKEVSDMVTVLRAGSLRIKPKLLDKARVGASLGEEYVKTAFYSTLAAFALIVFFMLFFYRRLGVFSVIGLVVNILILMGALAFLRATLTLPGIAGIILTLGMAVDGNILIYERLREEMSRGVKLVQAVKASFDKAAVTIIDANLTTLISGIILYFVGTGPIRGFATTLNIGILSTLFTVIVVTEALVMRDVKAGAKPYSMIKVLAHTQYKFMDWARICIPISMSIMVAGLILFAVLPNEKKLGIDFLGGYTVTARTQDPQSESKIRELVSSIPGEIGRSAQVTSITDSGSKATGYKSFRITFKLGGADTVAATTQNEGENGLVEIKRALEPVLQSGPIVVNAVPVEGVNKASGEVYFEDGHAEDDVVAALTRAGIDNATVAPFAGHLNAYTFQGNVRGDKSVGELSNSISGNFTGTKDKNGLPYRLSSPLPESAFVGAQVGGELRDKAALAVLLSLLGTILYLRVRFAEYSYGIAVVVSLAHDVLIALGALAFAAWTGILQAELDLAMIAAFLTIIGYSQNDTIVIFDRVRENIPKSKKPLREVLNDSINETLGRTILTTSTVVLTLLVLFLFNVGSRNVLEGFSYCMLVGVISGAYSTVYVASPVLMWLENRAKKKAGSNSDDTKKAEVVSAAR
ncbi:MAG: protein translocase subunit SecD [Planctomycetota bacterium]|nr:protein translocase subunit SecD [Planctomycetota bacterium]